MRVATFVVAVALLPSVALAQKPAAGKAPAVAPPPGPQASGETYVYEQAGRRDPFINLLAIGSETGIKTRKGEGAAGLLVADLSVRGVMQSRGRFYAVVAGPDGKTYMIHPADKLLDGTVKAVNAEGLVIVQEVNDPLSLVKQRETSKKLRSLEAKE